MMIGRDSGGAAGRRDEPTAGRIRVRGDGIVGCAAALALARLGMTVELLTSAVANRPDPAGTGDGDVRTYALNAASVELLRQIRVWDALPAAAISPVLEMQIQGDDAARLEFCAHAQGVEALAWIVDAGALEEALRQAVRYAPHIRLEVGSAPFTPPFTPPQGPTATRDLLLLCEGRDSEARQALGVRFERLPYGHQALATRVTASVPHAGVAWQWFGQPEVLALLPFERPQADASYGVVWSLPAERAQALLQAAPAEFEQALQAATAGACGELKLAGPRRTWPLVLGRADRVYGPGWMLLGDCAHAVHPLAGQGLNLGLADVRALARVMAEREPWRDLGDEKLLARAARERAGPNLAMAGLTDGLWHLFAQTNPLVRQLRNRGMNLLNQLPALKRGLTRRAIGLALAGLTTALSAALSTLPQPAWAQSGTSAAEAAIRRALAERMPSMPKPDEVQRGPVPGLWELRFGTEILYTDDKGDFLISGPIIETRTRKDLTAERVDKLTAIQFSALPLKDAIVIRQGNGSRKLVVFSDPNCGFCKRYERDLMSLKDVTLYTFLYPILGKDSQEKSRNIWCAADPAKAWRDWMVDGRTPPVAMGRCDASALERNMAFGQKHRVESTPTSVLEDGSRRNGALPTAEVDRLLNALKNPKS